MRNIFIGLMVYFVWAMPVIAQDTPWNVVQKNGMCKFTTESHGLEFGFVGDVNQTLLYMQKDSWKKATADLFSIKLTGHGKSYDASIDVRVMLVEGGVIRSVDNLVPTAMDTLPTDYVDVKFPGSDAEWRFGASNMQAKLPDFTSCVTDMKNAYAAKQQITTSFHDDATEEEAEGDNAEALYYQNYLKQREAVYGTQGD